MLVIQALLQDPRLPFVDKLRTILDSEQVNILTLVKDGGNDPEEFNVYVVGFTKAWDHATGKPIPNTALLTVNDARYGEAFAVVTEELRRGRRRYSLYPHEGDIGFDLQVTGATRRERLADERKRFQRESLTAGRLLEYVGEDELPF